VGFIDALDNVLANAKGRRLAARDRQKVLDNLKPGHTYWAIRSNGYRQDRPWVTPFTLETYTFKRERVLGILMANGGYPAANLVNDGVVLYPERPTIEILTAQEQGELNQANSSEEYEQLRVKLRKRLAREYPQAARRPMVEVKA